MQGSYPLSKPDAQSPCWAWRDFTLTMFSWALIAEKRKSRWKPGPIVSVNYMSACRLTSPRKKTAQRPRALPRNAVEPSQSSPKCLYSKYYWSAPIYYIFGSRQPWSQTLFKGGAQPRCLHRLWNDPPFHPRCRGRKGLFYIELVSPTLLNKVHDRMLHFLAVDTHHIYNVLSLSFNSLNNSLA